MTTMASQITSLTVVYSTVYSDAEQRKHQSSASLAFVWGIHRDRWIPHIKGQLRENVSISWRHREPTIYQFHMEQQILMISYNISRLFQYKDRIVQAPEKAIAEIIEEFDAANKSLDDSYKKTFTTANFIMQLIERLNSTSWLRVKEISDTLERYIDNSNMFKTELGQMFSSEEMADVFPRMAQFFADLRSRSRNLLDTWLRLSTDYSMMYGNMLTEPTTMTFYERLMEDMANYTANLDNSTTAEFYLAHFTYLMRISITEARTYTPEMLTIYMNADFPKMSWFTENTHIQRFFLHARSQTDIAGMVGNKDARFTSAVKKVQSSLNTFLMENEINFEFCR